MTPSPETHVVGISVSNSPDLSALGYGEEHLHETMIAIARALLRLGTERHAVHLAYGGDLRPGGFTETLFDLARAESQGEWTGRLYSYLAWPYYLGLSTGAEALKLNLCDFVRITPADAGIADMADDLAPDAVADGAAAFVAARCIGALRERMTSGGKPRIDGDPVPGLSARVLLGGKTEGYSGIMPGLFEEFLLAVEAGLPVYVLGGFGGAAGALAQALGETSGTLPAVFTLEHQRTQNPAVAELERRYLADPRLESPQQRYERLASAVDALRADFRLAGGDGPANGLDPGENARLMQSQNLTEITALIRRGLQKAWDGRPR